jgi:hypothetical protein
LFLSATGIGFINLWAGTRQMKLAVFTSRYAKNSATIPGYRTATDFFRRRLLHDWEFATHKSFGPAHIL